MHIFTMSSWRRRSADGRRLVDRVRGRSCDGPRQRPQADQVVHGGHEQELPFDLVGATMPQLAQSPDRLHPSKHFLDAFAMALTGLVPAMPRGAGIDRTPRALCDVRRDADRARRLDPRACVIGFVAADGGGPHRQRLEQVGGGLSLGGARRGDDARVHDQAVAILHQDLADIGELCFFARPLLRQSAVGIGRGLMRGVRAALPMKIHGRIARVLIAGPATGAIASGETLLPGPRLEQRAIDGEVLVRQHPSRPRLRQHRVKELPRNVAREQPLPILGKGRRRPHGVVHRQAHKPAEQQVIFQLLDQQALAPHRIERLQQQGPQQLLGRHRGATRRRVDRLELRRHPAQRLVGHRSNRAQRMIRRHALLRRQIAKQVPTLLIVSAYAMASGPQCSTTIGVMGTPFSAAC